MKIPFFSLLFSAVHLSCWATVESQSSAAVSNSDDFDPKLDGKGVDASVFQDLPCVSSNPERLVNSEKIIAIQGSTVNYESPGLDILLDYVDELVVTGGEFTFFVEGVGVFVGIDDVVEYNDLAQGVVNNGFMNIERRELLSIECVEKDAPINEDAKIIVNNNRNGNTRRKLPPGSLNNTDNNLYGDKEELYEGSVSLRVTFREEVFYNYGNDHVYRVGQHVHTYAANSDLLLSYRSQLDPVLIDAVSESVPTPEIMCKEGALRCTGDLFPYDSLEHCYETLSSLPHSCGGGERCYDCVDQNTVFLGDTLQCRSLHMLSAKLRPSLHCPHLGSFSAPCQPQNCPEFTERKPLEQVQEDLEPFDASLSTWFRVVELVFAIGLFLLPILSFASYRKVRSHACKSCRKSPCHCHRGQKLTVEMNEQTEMSLPRMTCALRLRYVDHEDGTVMSAKNIDFGGCRMTALSGKSGSGKSTFMKLVCGIHQPHMELEMRVTSSKQPRFAYVPQSSEMWPRFMSVRDILLFTAKLQGCDLQEYVKCVDALRIRDLLDQTFASLSGGEQQRVHILANLMHPKPSLIFMDEPVSALDENNAVACLKLLHELPVKHAFVITMHQMSPRLQENFDRVLEIDLDQKKLIKKHYSFDSYNALNTNKEAASAEPHEQPTENKELMSDDGGNQQSFVGSTQSLFFLWHALFWGWPVFDIGALVLGVVNSVILGAMGANSLETLGPLVDFVPSRIGTRIPVFLLQFLANIAALSAFVVALVYSIEDRKLLFHFSKQGKLRPSHIAVFNFLRSAYYGVIFATILLSIPLAMMNILEDMVELDTMIINAALFSTAYTMLSYVAAQLVPPLYSSQILLLTFLPMTLFTGIFFPWDTLSMFFKILHYLNPLFWCLTANTHLLLDSFDARCHAGADPFLICAESDALISLAQLQDLSSMDSQLISAALLALSMLILFVMHRQVLTYKTLDADLDDDLLESHRSVHDFKDSNTSKTVEVLEKASKKKRSKKKKSGEKTSDPVGRRLSSTPVGRRLSSTWEGTSKELHSLHIDARADSN